MTNQATTDKRFLTELVDRADATPRDRISGREIAEAIGATHDDVEDIVTRLRSQDLVAFTNRPRKSAEKLSMLDIRPTPQGRIAIRRGLGA